MTAVPEEPVRRRAGGGKVSEARQTARSPHCQPNLGIFKWNKN